MGLVYSFRANNNRTPRSLQRIALLPFQPRSSIGHLSQRVFAWHWLISQRTSRPVKARLIRRGAGYSVL